LTGIEGRINQAASQIDEWIQPAGVKGAAIVVMLGGEIVAERYAGEARPGIAVTADTLFGLASVTKPLAAAGVVAALEDGLFALDEPIGRMLPGFLDAGGPDRGQVTVRDLLRHTGGLAEDLGDARSTLPPVPTLGELVDAHLQEPLRATPGVSVVYSNSGLAILSRLVETVTGEDFWDWTRRRVQVGNSVIDLIARPGEGLVDRITSLADAANAGTPIESYNSRWWRDTAVPWGGAFGTPRAAAAFAAAFLDHTSESIGLSPAARRAMTTDQTHGLAGGVTSGRVWWEQQSWGLGWEVKGSKRRHWTGELTSPATFCHFGQAGTLVWADPALDLAVAVFTNRSVARFWGFILSRWLRLGNAIAAAV
jgi:beta-lactamase class C